MEEDECHSWTGSDTYHFLWFIDKNMSHHLKQVERAGKCSLGTATSQQQGCSVAGRSFIYGVLSSSAKGNPETSNTTPTELQAGALTSD